MRRAALAGALILVLRPAGVGAQVATRSGQASAACQGTSTSLCLNGGRFLVEAAFSTPQGQSGQGQAIPLTSDTGYFWFFSANNVEMVVKVVDGRAVNNRFWVFAAGLTDVNVVMTVTDTQTGVIRTYTNPQGVAFQPIQDTGAFSSALEGGLKAPVAASAVAEAADGIEAGLSHSLGPAGDFARLTAEAASAACIPDATTLCLNNGRFKVQAQWATPQGQSGAGQAVALTEDTGYFWFFSPNNVEMVLKVVNGCPLNSRFWVFAGGLTDVQVDLNVVDTVAHTSRVYRNPIGAAFQPIQDTAALQTCSCNTSTFTSTDVPKAIPDPGTAESALVVPAGDPVAAVAVRLTVTHPFDSDLKIQLVSPSGNVVTLTEAIGTWGHDFTSTVFDDAASSSILSQLPPFTGTFRPAEPLAAFAGSPRAGTWTLRVTDLRARYAGQLVSWGLDITSCDPLPVPAPKAVGAPELPPLPTGVPAGNIPVEGTLITVTTNADDPNGQNDGTISLRQALWTTNNSPGTYTIRFAPALAGKSIDITEPLPPLSGGGVLVDGDINGDGRPDVTITFKGPPGGVAGLTVSSSNNRLHALAVKGFPWGIQLATPFRMDAVPSRLTLAQNIVSGVEVTGPGVTGSVFSNGIVFSPVYGHPECFDSPCDTHNSWVDTRLVGNHIDSVRDAIEASLTGTTGDSIQRITVAGNDIHIGTPGGTANSTAVGLAAGYPGKPAGAENKVSDALVAYNAVDAAGHAFAITAAAGSGCRAQESNLVEDLGIVANRVRHTALPPLPEAGRGFQFAISDGCGPSDPPLDNDIIRRVRVVGNLFAGQDDAGVLANEACCTGNAGSFLTDMLIAGNVIQGIIPPKSLNPWGIEVGGTVNVSNITIDSNTIEQETTAPQADHVADLAGGGIGVIGGLGSTTIYGPIPLLQNVTITNNRIDTDLAGITLLGGGPSDQYPFDVRGHRVSSIVLRGNVIGRPPSLAMRLDPGIKGISLIGGLSGTPPGSDRLTKVTDCTVTGVTLDGNLVAGVVDDVSVRSNIGEGASGNLAALGLRPPTVTVAKAGNGSGTVTSNPAGINCGAACSAPFDDRSAVTLSAVAAAGSTFAGWSGDCSGSGTCALTMNGDHSVTATFSLR